MKRRMPILLTVLSLLLALASAVLWARSLYADDVWEFTPREIPWGSSGWFSYWIVGSSDGRLVLIEHEELDVTAPRVPIGGWGKVSPPVPATKLAKSTYFVPTYNGRVTELSLGGTAEWASTPRQYTDGGRYYFALSWPALAFVCAFIPALRWWRLWRRRSRRPAFPVLASGDEQSASVAHVSQVFSCINGEVRRQGDQVKIARP